MQADKPDHGTVPDSGAPILVFAVLLLGTTLGLAGTAEQWIKEGKAAIRWTRLSFTKFRSNEVRLQLHALAHNLANILRTLTLPKEVEQWCLTTLREKLVKIGAKAVAHARYAVFQMADIAVPRNLMRRILENIADLRRPADPAA